MFTGFQVTLDAHDPATLSEFWALALGYITQPPPSGFETWDDWAAAMEIPEAKWNDARALVDPDGAGPRIFFQRVPEGKTAKNRVHLDVNVGGEPKNRIAAVDRRVGILVEAGAERLEEFNLRGERWVVMRDPEGNEFCVQ